MKSSTLAIFDFDGTITKKDTFIAFIQFVFGKTACYTGFFLHIPLLIGMFLKIIPNASAKEKIFSYFFKDMPENTFQEWCEKFAIHIDGITYTEATNTFSNYISQQITVIIISASIRSWIAPWARRKGIHIVLGTEIEIENNKLTGKFSSKNCHGVEKVNRLKILYPDYKNYHIIAYGDSSGDAALLELADESYFKEFKK